MTKKRTGFSTSQMTLRPAPPRFGMRGDFYEHQRQALDCDACVGKYPRPCSRCHAEKHGLMHAALPDDGESEAVLFQCDVCGLGLPDGNQADLE